MVFHSVNHCIQTEKHAGKLFDTVVIPTPSEVTSDCGLALKLNIGEFEAIKEFHKSLMIPADVYFIGNNKINGKRKTEKVL